MKKFIITSVLLAAFFLAAGQENAQRELAAAIYEEEVDGDLEKAIEAFKAIVKDYTDNRPVAAKAQLHIGICYEKLGKQQATEAYNKVLEQFADQQQTAEMARTRLQSLTTANTTNVAVNKTIPSLKQIPLEKGNYDLMTIDFSPTGESFAFADRPIPGKQMIYIVDASGAPVNTLNKESEYIEGIPSYSPNGEYIAYFRNKLPGHSPDSSGLIEVAIYIVDTKGGKPNRITENFKLHGGQGLIWHPDGQHFSTMIDSKKIITFNMKGEITNSILIDLDLKGRYILTGYSPDGKWISYFKYWFPWNKDAKCGFISVKGDRQTEFGNADIPATYGTWSSKNYYYYIAGNPQNQNVYRVKIDLETGEKASEPEQITNYVDVNISQLKYIREKSGLFFLLEKKMEHVIDVQADNPEDFKTIANGANPVLSPDGQIVYFVGIEKDNQGIYSVPRIGGIKKKLTDIKPTSHYSGKNFPYFSLSPDGNSISFFTKRNNYNIDLYFLSVDGKKLFKSITMDYTSKTDNPSITVVPSWSPDSKEVTFSLNNKLYLISAWNKNLRELADVKEWEDYSTKWSPNGEYIAGFVNDNDLGNLNVVIVSTQTGEVKRLTTDEEKDYKENLEWHPDGTKLSYFLYRDDGKNTNDPDNADEVRIAYIDGRPTEFLFDQPDVWDFWGTWHPNGIDYYFWGDPIPGMMNDWSLYKYNSVTKKFNLLLNNPDPSNPSFSRDGKYMVFCRSESRNQLWMMEGVE